MNQIRPALTYYSQIFKRKIVSAVLIAGTATVLLATPALAAGTSYNCGAYGNGTYNGTTACSGSSSSGTAPNTGAGVYTPSGATTTVDNNNFWDNSAGLAGGVILIALGVIVIFWIVPKRKY